MVLSVEQRLIHIFCIFPLSLTLFLVCGFRSNLLLFNISFLFQMQYQKLVFGENKWHFPELFGG